MIDWKNKQNRDGGWAYNKGCSWTEPTVFVLLAQLVTQVDRPAFEAGLKYIYSTQRSDGGWSPQSGVTESTWVTALAALLPEEAIGAARLKQALAWLREQTGMEATWKFRLGRWLTHDNSANPAAWSWFPGTAAWAIPTSFGILAFERALRRGENGSLRERVNSGCDYLAVHVCADGGWNRGSSHALGRDGESYPETTGIALAALRHSPDRRLIERGKAAAHRHLATCRTAEGIAWLRMGLAAHGETVQSAFQAVPRTTLDAALNTLANVPPEKNPLLS